MNISRSSTVRVTLIISLLLAVTIASSRLHAETGPCGDAATTLPFTDVPASNIFFCSIASAFFTGLTNGTTPTTYSPSANVTREQMAAFVSRTMDQSLKRGSRRAALDQHWTPSSLAGLTSIDVGGAPKAVKSDGADLWVTATTFSGGTVVRVRASDGKLLETWTGAGGASGILAAKGLIFVIGNTAPSKLYQIDPTQIAGAVTTLPITLGASPLGISFDGERIWTANFGGSVSIVTLNPLAVNNVTTGFTTPFAILNDGANMWVTDVRSFASPGKLFKLNATGGIIQTIDVGTNPRSPVFDGTNIWVPNSSSNSVTVVRASTGAVIATLTGNGLDKPQTAAFDGERILVTSDNNTSGEGGVSLWKAADLTPLGFIDTGRSGAACSDGLNFWILLTIANKLARF